MLEKESNHNEVGKKQRINNKFIRVVPELLHWLEVVLAFCAVAVVLIGVV